MNNSKETRKNNKNYRTLRSKSGLNPFAKSFTPNTRVNNTKKNKNTNNMIENLSKRINKLNINNSINSLYLPSSNPNDYIAIDCEMVGVGPRKQSALAEVSLVNFDGKTIYHEYVKPDSPVTDYRTFVSGITPEILREKGKPFRIVKEVLQTLLRGKILVGHGLQNDINAIQIDIPKSRRWDTTEIPMFMRKPEWGGPLQPKKLKTLVKNFVGKNIQTGEHSATEDAEASMELFRWYLLNVAIPRLIK